MMKKTTIKDIARALGIHHTTVSRALRDHPDVKPETKEKIKKMAEKLNYQPNLFARNLRNNQANLIGVLVPEIQHHFFASAISGMEEIAQEHGYVLLVCQSNENYEREVMNTKALFGNRVAGMLVSVAQTTRTDEHFRWFLKSGGRIVFFDRVLDIPNTIKVVVDDRAGGYKATKYLIDKGRKRIAHIGGTKNLLISHERYNGYVQALQEAGLPVDKRLVVWSGFHEENGAKAIKQILKRGEPPDAVFAVNDPVALGAMTVLKQRGLKIPRDVSVVGFSNNPISAFVDPPLTTIEQPAYQMGMEAIKALLEQVQNGEEPPEDKKIVLKTKLIIRSSA